MERDRNQDLLSPERRQGYRSIYRSDVLARALGLAKHVCDRVGITLDDQRTDLLVEYILDGLTREDVQASDIAEYATKLYVEKLKDLLCQHGIDF